MSKYNGWTNWETWNCNLWLNNEYNTYSYYRDLAKKYSTYELSRIIKDEIEEGADDLTITGFYRDMLNGSISEIDFYEIAEAFREGMDEEDDDDDEDDTEEGVA